MTDDEELTHTVRLAGVEVTFRGPLEEGRTPPHDLNAKAEATLAALGTSGRSRLLRLSHGVQTGVEAGVIRREHLRVLQAAVGGDKPEKCLYGDEKINGRVAAYLSSRDEIAAAWWVYAHEAEAAGAALQMLGAILAGLDEVLDEVLDELVLSALWRSLEEAGTVRA